MSTKNVFLAEMTVTESLVDKRKNEYTGIRNLFASLDAVLGEVWGAI
jgi:hypothetical protein